MVNARVDFFFFVFLPAGQLTHSERASALAIRSGRPRPFARTRTADSLFFCPQILGRFRTISNPSRPQLEATHVGTSSSNRQPHATAKESPVLSRSTLAFSAFALLAAGGVMAAAGPDMNKRADGDSKLSIRVDIGDHGGGGGGWGHRHPVYRPAPVVIQQPVVVAPVIVEAVPRTLDLQAFQSAGTVIILARGENTTSGFTTGLELTSDRLNDGIRTVKLRNFGPACDPRAEVCTPFSVSGGFATRERLNEVHVIVAGQDRCIPVQRIDPITVR
jgi:hypothetical protein